MGARVVFLWSFLGLLLSFVRGRVWRPAGPVIGSLDKMRLHLHLAKEQVCLFSNSGRLLDFSALFA